MIKKALTALFVLGVLLALAVVWVAGTYLTKPVPKLFPNTPERAVSVRFSSESGSTISGWLYRAESPKAVAILMHGIRSNRGQMVPRAEHLQALNITTLIFDFQAHGESPGEIITLGHLESFDARAAVEYIKEIEPNLPLAVIGVSMGGAAALLSQPTINMDVLVLESVYPDVYTAISNRLASRIPGGELLTPLLSYQIKPRAGISADALSTVNVAGGIKTASLVLNGSEDTHTTVADTYNLYNALAKPKMISIIDGAGHVDLEKFNSQLYWDIVQPFIIEHLKLTN